MAKYAYPDVLVTTQWVADHQQDPNVRIVESDEDPLVYQQGHIAGAVRLDWHTELRKSRRARLRRPRKVRASDVRQGDWERYDRRVVRRQEQLVGLLRLLGDEAVRPCQVRDHGRRPEAMGARRPSVGRAIPNRPIRRPSIMPRSKISRSALSARKY